MMQVLIDILYLLNKDGFCIIDNSALLKKTWRGHSKTAHERVR